MQETLSKYARDIKSWRKNAARHLRCATPNLIAAYQEFKKLPLTLPDEKLSKAAMKFFRLYQREREPVWLRRKKR